MEIQKQNPNTNIIPPIIHPLGANWLQPDTKNILLDDHNAVIGKQDFQILSEYSFSYPTGKYNGKMWKAQKDRKWLLCWYHGENSVTHEISISHREILIID